jgi:hypothetical protein
MRVLLDDRGQREIWKYDIVPMDTAARIAVADLDFDNMKGARDAVAAGHPYALIGAGIVDHYFTTPAQLAALLVWLCCDGYLNCYARDRRES